MSLLTITAGRSLATSPARDGSKLTHQTSPRFIGNVPDGSFGPIKRFGFACLVLGHLLVCVFEVLAHHVGAHEPFDEAAYLATADHRVQTVVDAFVEGNGEFLLHRITTFNTC